MSTFSKLMQRPSAVKLWQMPLFTAFPIPFPVFARLLPLDEHDTSYFAESAKIFSFFWVISFMSSNFS
jgi:hypothetical protein